MRRYSELNTDDLLGQGILKLHFISNSWPDIAKKLQKIENWKDKSLDDLLREAQKVYVRWDEEKQKQKPKIMLSTLGQKVKKKALLKELDINLLQNLGKEGRIHRPQAERKKTNIQCGKLGHFK
jgi:hypothetical protein